METFGERVRERRKEKGITLEEIEAVTGLSNSNLSKIERNKISPSLDAAILISNCLNESLDYLAKGIVIYNEIDEHQRKLLETYEALDENNRYALKAYAAFLLSNSHSNCLGQVLNKNRNTNSKHKIKTIREEKSVYLPILGTVAAGRPIMANELVEGFLPVPAKKVKKNTYIVKVEGASMVEAGINTGDLVIINPQPTVEQGEIALVRVDGNVTIKKFYRYEHEIRLKPANQAMRNIVVEDVEDLTKVQVLGKVIGVIPVEEAIEKIREEFNGPNE